MYYIYYVFNERTSLVCFKNHNNQLPKHWRSYPYIFCSCMHVGFVVNNYRKKNHNHIVNNILGFDNNIVNIEPTKFYC